MKALREIAEYLSSRCVLSSSQQERLTELGVLTPPHWVYNDCPCCDTDSADEYSECPRCLKWECQCTGVGHCLHCGQLPCCCNKQSSKSQRKPKPRERITAAEIGNRVEAQQLLDLPSLKVLERFKDFSANEPDDCLLKFLASGLKADILWEALSFEKFHTIVSEDENYGPAAHAWTALLQGLSRESLGSKSWILAQHPALAKVWRCQRTLNSLFRSLGRLLEEETLILAKWSAANFHPLGSPAMGLVYVAISHSMGRPPQGEQKPVWSPWDGQCLATRWKEHYQGENVARIWELALKLSPVAVFKCMERSFLDNEQPILPILTHPQAWCALQN